ncbi:MAG: DNA-deoxyinosine glycosylase [Lachnospiraceae bacterium]|jgi:hypoxanthine-DNA glycosylase|nr:DNA-deoxyinosine glycosylase [Lachnospiraceae bacterium]
METILHPIPPLYDAHTKILILGSFPSVKSREGCFFYHHPQNRFWRVLSLVLDTHVPETVEEKKALLHSRHIALWDVIASCTITGSSDSSIKNVVPNDLSRILEEAEIAQIFCNGGASHRFFQKYQKPLLGRDAIRLPSTSPANAAWSLERLAAEWTALCTYV